MTLKRSSESSSNAGPSRSPSADAPSMPTRSCSVSFKGTSGIRHGVEVEAESLYEAAVKAIARFRADPWMEQVGNATSLDIEIRESATKHAVTLKQVESWLASVSTSPHVASKKTRLKMMLMRG